MLIEILIAVALGSLMHATLALGKSSSISHIGLSIGFMMLLSLFAGRLMKRLGLPKLTGYIIAGVLVGPYILHLLSHEMVADLGLINGVAVCLIALTAGGELNIRKLKPLLPTILSMTWWTAFGSALFLGLAIFAMQRWLPFMASMTTAQVAIVSLLLGVTISAKSPAVVMAIFNETQVDGPVSQTMLGVVVCADLVIVVLFAVTSAVTNVMLIGSVDAASAVGSILWGVFGSVGVGAVVGAVLAFYISRIQDGTDLFALLMCTVIAVICPAAGLDPMIVMLAAGIYIENVSSADASKLIRDIEGASLPVFVVFFCIAGAGLHLSEMKLVILPALVLVALRAGGFWAGARVATKRTQAAPAVASFAWIGLLPQAGLALALALIIDRTFSATFGAAGAALVLGIVGVNELIMPVVLRNALLRSGEAGKRQQADFAELTSDQEALTSSDTLTSSDALGSHD